jgi:sorbitol-specific phosphotransferase system component IIBC
VSSSLAAFSIIPLPQAILEDLHASRQAQQAVKLTQQAEMAQHEKNEFERIIQVNRAKEEQEALLAQKVWRLVLKVSMHQKARHSCRIRSTIQSCLFWIPVPTKAASTIHFAGG